MTDLRDRITTEFQKRVANPVMRLVPTQTLLETTGRRSPQMNSVAVRTFGTNLLTIRVDLTD